MERQGMQSLECNPWKVISVNATDAETAILLRAGRDVANKVTVCRVIKTWIQHRIMQSFFKPRPEEDQGPRESSDSADLHSNETVTPYISSQEFLFWSGDAVFD
jgi:hypothetical protein